MHIVHVYVNVKPERVGEFTAATIENARNSVLEPGVARFDFIRQADTPNLFILVEVYRSAEAAAAHKQTAHYAKWRDAVDDMMAEPRSGVKFANVFPDDTGWD